MCIDVDGAPQFCPVFSPFSMPFFAKGLLTLGRHPSCVECLTNFGGCNSKMMGNDTARSCVNADGSYKCGECRYPGFVKNDRIIKTYGQMSLAGTDCNMPRIDEVPEGSTTAQRSATVVPKASLTISYNTSVLVPGSDEESAFREQVRLDVCAALEIDPCTIVISNIRRAGSTANRRLQAADLVSLLQFDIAMTAESEPEDKKSFISDLTDQLADESSALMSSNLTQNLDAGGGLQSCFVCPNSMVLRGNGNESATCRYCDAGTEPRSGTASGDCPKSSDPGDDSEQETCVACPDGLVSVNGRGCTSCPAGKQPRESRTSCVTCPDGKYSDSNVAGANGTGGICQRCPLDEPGTEPNRNRTKCVCKENWYSYVQDVDDTHLVPYTTPPQEDSICELCCHPCPSDSSIDFICPGGDPAAIDEDAEAAGMELDLAHKAVVFPAKNFWMTQTQAKEYARQKFLNRRGQSIKLSNHSCEIVKGEPICFGFDQTFVRFDHAAERPRLSGELLKTCNDSDALQAPHFCVAG